jgi:hypothetical protein
MELIRELCSFEGRGPGTDAERRAANFLAGRLRAIGRRAEVEATYVHPQWPAIHAIHAAFAIAGSVVAVAEPAAGFAFVLLAAVSMYLDLNTRLYLIRSLLFRRGSQNVLSRGSRPDAPATLILTAHYDAARTGYLYGPRLRRLARRLSEGGRLTLGPFRLLFWGGVAPLLPILGARMAGFEPAWLGALQLLPTVLLLVAAFLLLDVALSDVVPGAYDNASGVSGVLSAAAALERDPPPHLDVWVLLTGAGESLHEGMRSFMRAHRHELDRERTVLLNVDSVSHGEVTYQVSEGAVVGFAMDPRLIELCDAIAAADREGRGRYRAQPARSPLLTDALPARVRGYRAITIMTSDDGLPPPWYHRPEDTPERVDSGALERATEFTLALVSQVDADVGRRLGGVRPREAPLLGGEPLV